MFKTELIKPAPAMDEHDDGIRPIGFRQTLLTELQSVFAIIYAVIGDIRRQRLNLAPRYIQLCYLRQTWLPNFLWEVAITLQLGQVNHSLPNFRHSS